MTGTKYLSELVDSSALQKGALNIIKAPTGSGKTYFALQHIPTLIEDAVVYRVFRIVTIIFCKSINILGSTPYSNTLQPLVSNGDIV